MRFLSTCLLVFLMLWALGSVFPTFASPVANMFTVRARADYDRLLEMHKDHTLLILAYENEEAAFASSFEQEFADTCSQLKGRVFCAVLPFDLKTTSVDMKNLVSNIEQSNVLRSQFVMIHKGAIVPFRGGSKASSAVPYVTRFLGPDRVLIHTVPELKLALQDRPLVVGYFVDTNTPLYSAWAKMAALFKGEFPLAETTAPNVLSHVITAQQGDPNFMRKPAFSQNVIVIYRDFADPLMWVSGLELVEDVAMVDDLPPTDEEVAARYAEMEPLQVEKLIASKLTGWLRLNTRGFAKEVNKDSFQYLVNQEKPAVLMWIDPSSDKKVNARALQTFQQLSSRFHNIFSFAYADASSARSQPLVFGNSGTTYPCVTVLQLSLDAQLKYPFPEDQELTRENLERHVGSILTGRIKPTIRNQELKPEDEFETFPIERRLNYENFLGVVEDPTKNVLVVFWTQSEEDAGETRHKVAWQTFHQFADYLGELLTSHDVDDHWAQNLIIGHYDLEANELPPKYRSVVSGGSYPPVRLFPKDLQSLDSVKSFTHRGLVSPRGVFSWLKFVHVIPRGAEMPDSFADEEQAWFGYLQPVTGLHLGALRDARKQVRESRQQTASDDQEKPVDSHQEL